MPPTAPLPSTPPTTPPRRWPSPTGWRCCTPAGWPRRPPADVYAEPDDLAVARLTGPVSVLQAPVRAAAANRYTIDVGDAQATVPAGSAPGADPAAAPAILVRPDWARLAGPVGPDATLPGVVAEIRFRGPHTDYHVDTPAGMLLIRESGPPRVTPGPVRWSLLRARLMPP